MPIVTDWLETKRAADRQHEVADLQPIAVSPRNRFGVAASIRDGQVGFAIDPLRIGRNPRPSLKRTEILFQGRGVVHDVAVRDDEIAGKTPDC